MYFGWIKIDLNAVNSGSIQFILTIVAAFDYLEAFLWRNQKIGNKNKQSSIYCLYANILCVFLKFNLNLTQNDHDVKDPVLQNPC